ncbi:hypothetical protein RJ640_016956 [Escallonia rubra]|uniref:Pentatricopeptide repeat-containing protein n=1 Tax=Escallonia rubra TaxID=112253 RepID=A0AA88UK38_9ASTE|nr:hypothetical protein RJ640_016956 [Escallonia rubra]
MPQRRYSSRVVLWTFLFSRHSKFGLFNKDRTLSEIMPERNFGTHNAMLSGYVQCGRLSDAWRFFYGMKEKSVGLVDIDELGIARSAAKWLLEWDPLSALAHMVLCNMYAATGQHGD